MKVPINHHDLFRFLWWEDGDVRKQMIECRMTVYIFGTVCSSSAANFDLRRITEECGKYFDPSTVSTVKKLLLCR